MPWVELYVQLRTLFVALLAFGAVLTTAPVVRTGRTPWASHGADQSVFWYHPGGGVNGQPPIELSGDLERYTQRVSTQGPLPVPNGLQVQ